MKIRFAAAFLTLALPVLAQEPAAAENLFYKAYWLERGERNFAEASTLYQQFLEKAPEHRLAKKAATLQFELLTRSGKTKEAEAFAQQYKTLLGDVAVGAPADAPAEGEARPGRGEGRGRGAQGGDAPRGNPQERLAELKKQLEEAKAAGDDEQVARLERQIARLEQMGQGGGAGGQGGGQRGQGGQRGALGPPVKFAEMTKEQIDEFKTQRLERMSGFIDRMRENGQEERAKQMEDGIAAVKKALDENKLEDAQKAYDKLMEGMRTRRGGG